MNTPSSSRSTLPPTPEQIRQRAREIWHERGEPSGDDVSIWLEAERQLSEVASQAASSRDAAAVRAAPPPAADVPRAGSAVAPSRRGGGLKKTKTGGKSLQEKVQESLPTGGYGEGGPQKVGPST